MIVLQGQILAVGEGKRGVKETGMLRKDLYVKKKNRDPKGLKKKKKDDAAEEMHGGKEHGVSCEPLGKTMEGNVRGMTECTPSWGPLQNPGRTRQGEREEGVLPNR